MIRAAKAATLPRQQPISGRKTPALRPVLSLQQARQRWTIARLSWLFRRAATAAATGLMMGPAAMAGTPQAQRPMFTLPTYRPSATEIGRSSGRERGGSFG